MKKKNPKSPLRKRSEASEIRNPKSELDIDYVAKLAGLKLTPDEEKTFDRQLAQVLDYFSQLTEVETEKVEPIGHITGLENIIREDETAPSLAQDEAIGQAPRVKSGFIEVEAILENQGE